MKHAKWRPIVGSFLVAIMISGVSTAFVNVYNEDFTTETFKDTNTTTADWSTADGELRLPLFAPGIVGAYDSPGGAWRVKIFGSHAFVADLGGGLQIVDVSDPTSPTQIGNAIGVGDFFGVDVEGQYAYVAAGVGGVHVIDISNRLNPVVVGSAVPSGTQSVVDVAVSGDYAYSCDETARRIAVININNPSSPSAVTTRTTPNDAFGVAVSGDYLFVACHSSGMRIFDISTPANPSEVSSFSAAGGQARDVFVDGQFAYLAYGPNGLQIVDISDPTNPVGMGALNLSSFVYNVAVTGGYAYVASSPNGVDVVDVSDPTNPVLVENMPTAGDAIGIDIAGNRLFVADLFQGGLVVADIADSMPTPLMAGEMDTPGDARRVMAAGNIAYVADGSSGLQLLDIADPTTPSTLGGYDTPGTAQGIALSWEHALVADGDSLLIVDVSDPSSPSRMGAVQTPGTASGVDVSGDMAIVADGNSGIQVVFVQDPTNPSIIGNTATPGTASSVEIDGNRVMVADGSSGLQIYGVSNPFSPSLIGSYDTPGFARDLTVSGEVVCVADGDSGVQFVDISTPSSPSLLGNFQTTGAAFGISAAGDMAFVAADSGLQVVDFSDPTTPMLIGSYPTGDIVWDVAVSGDHAMLANAAAGVRSIQVYQRLMMPDQNVGHSFEVDAATDTIQKVRLSTQETGSIMWELSADGGSNFEPVTPDGSYHTFANPGNSLIWRATLMYDPTSPKANPTVTDVALDWLYDFALIDSIVDVPNDQGKQVSISWGRSATDFVGESPQVVEYAVHRWIDPNLSTVDPTAFGRDMGEFESSASAMAGWHFLMTVPADAEDQYAVVAPTLKDSTIIDGIYYSVFMVRARTASPGVFTDSPSDSGYSVDNLIPGVPGQLVVAFNTGSGNQLSWEFPTDPDVQFFKIYRSLTPDFVPGPSNLVHSTGSTQWLDPVSEGYLYSYKISAVDFSGNEGDAATASTLTGVPNPKPTLPSSFALYQSSPNPFNPSTVVRYDVPAGGGKVTLAVFDVGGRLIRTLVDGQQTPGEKQITWNGKDNGGKQVASGVYFYRLQAPGFERTMKMTLLQ